MRRISQALAVAAAVAGLCLTVLPAGASTAGTRQAGGHGLTAAQRRALRTAEHLRALRAKRGIITGLVRRPGGAPAPNVCVIASGPMGRRKAFTRPDGTFLLAGLPAGAYRVEYRGCSPIGKVTGQYYGGPTLAAAAQVQVTGGAPTRLAPVTLSTLGSLAALRSQLGQPASAPRRPVSASQRAAIAAAEIASGQLPRQAGTGHTGHVTGRVTTRSGRPLAGVCVLAAPRNSGRFYVAGASTTATGHYRMRLLAGHYYIVFLPTCARHVNYAPQLWKAAGSIGRARVVTVRAGHTVTGVGAALGIGAQVTGRVRTHAKSPHPSLGGLCVFAVGTKGQRLFQASTRTRKDGSFTLGNLATGTYRLEVDPYCSRSPVWLPSAPVTFTVTNGKVTLGVNAWVKLGGAISGVVSDANGKPLGGICVNAGSQNFGFGTFTMANGTYTFTGLPAGSYQIDAETGCGNNGPYGAVVLPNPVTVHPGAVTAHVNLVLPFDGSMSGVVSDAHGHPLSGICVQAVGPGFTFGFATTAADGSYTMKNVAPGSYQVTFVPGGVFSSCGNNGNYLPATASATVTSQATTTLDAVLPTGGTISGTVTDAHGQPLSGVCVFSSSPYGNQVVSKADGSYRLAQLFTGSYFVGFVGGCGNTGSVAPQAYRGDPTFWGPASIAVTQGSVTAGIDARMKPGATITGRLTNQAGHPVSGVCVYVIGYTGAGGGGNFFDFTVDQRGQFSDANLPPGQYNVVYSGMFSRRHGCTRSPYADWQFGGKPAWGVPNLIFARGGTVTSGANGVLPLAGRISGLVTDRAGHALPFMCAQVFSSSGAGPMALTGRRGAYTLGALPPGRYKVEFSNCGGGFIFFAGQTSPNYASRWYKNKPALRTATVVVVRASTTATRIDGALPRGGSISGQVVYRPNRRPVSFVCVDAVSLHGGVFTAGFGLTDRRGRYVVNGLSTGRYEVDFQPCAGESALAGVARTGIPVVTGQRRRGVNEALTLGGSVSGVTSALVNGQAQPAPGTCVLAIPTRATSLASITIAQQGGSYTATNLAPGPYELLAGDTSCSSDAPALTTISGHLFTISAGHTTSGVDVSLPLTGAIAGVVHGGGHALGGVCAEAYRLGGGTAIPVGVTRRSGGRYTIGDLQPGRYKIRFTTGCGASGWATRWYKNARTEQAGAVVLVRSATVTTGINATLPRG